MISMSCGEPLDRVDGVDVDGPWFGTRIEFVFRRYEKVCTVPPETCSTTCVTLAQETGRHISEWDLDPPGQYSQKINENPSVAGLTNTSHQGIGSFRIEAHSIRDLWGRVKIGKAQHRTTASVCQACAINSCPTAESQGQTQAVVMYFAKMNYAGHPK